MPMCKISLPGPVSRTDISTLAVELIKLLLYYRGQFPTPLEEALKLVNQKLSCQQNDHEEPNLTFKEKSVKKNFVIYEDPLAETTNETCTGKKEASFKQSFVIYEDPLAKTTNKIAYRSKEILQKKLNVTMQKAEKQFCDSVMQFENYLHNLQFLLENNNISEVVLNLGRNFRLPNELFHIKLPLLCKYCDCSKHSLSLRKCKLHLIKTVIENQQLWKDNDLETLMHISVMILIPSNMPIAESMEQKTLYKIPTRRKYHTFQLMKSCSHDCQSLEASLEDIEVEHKSNSLYSTDEAFDGSSNNDVKSETLQGSHIWVQLKPVLKGFKENFTPKAPENSIWL